MNIQPIVEGHGQVSAVPVLLRRLRDESRVFEVDVNRPLRRKRSELVLESGVRQSVRLALLQDRCGAILILFDADDDCPKELAPQVLKWACSEAGSIPVAVVVANREYEAWFLGALESLRGRRSISDIAVSPNQPETSRDAKGKLEEWMPRSTSYSETVDQVALSALFDMGAAHRTCRSFRKMVSAFGELVTRMGTTLPEWPPQDWSPSN